MIQAQMIWQSAAELEHQHQHQFCLKCLQIERMDE